MCEDTMTEPRSKIPKLIPPGDDGRRSGTENTEAEPGTTPPVCVVGTASVRQPQTRLLTCSQSRSFCALSCLTCCCR